MKIIDITLPLNKFCKKYFGQKEWYITLNKDLLEEEIRKIYIEKKEEFERYKECYFAILSILAEHKNISSDILKELSKIRDEGVLTAVALHSKTPKKILKKLMNSRYNLVREHVCFNENLSLEEIKFMLKKEKVKYVREAIERAISNKKG